MLVMTLTKCHCKLLRLTNRVKHEAVKHVKRRKDHFQESHSQGGGTNAMRAQNMTLFQGNNYIVIVPIVAQKHGDPKIWPLYRKVFSGGIIGKKNDFPIVAAIPGEPKKDSSELWSKYCPNCCSKYDPCAEFFFRGGIIANKIVFPMLPSHSQCQSGWTVMSFLLFLCKGVALWNKQKWKLQSVNAKVPVSEILQVPPEKDIRESFHTIVLVI